MKKYLAILLSFVMLFAAFNTQAEDDDEANFSDAELEQILAPIALYPDSVLTHILIAATYPLEVIQANRWVENNPDLPPADAMDRVENEEWDPSVKALIPFPTVLKRLSEDLDWTQKLGDAFLQDEERVLDSIQSLRRKADKAGNLSQMENVKVVREEKVIVLEPAEPEVIYVPYYDSRVVYGPWYWDNYPPIYWHSPYYVSHYRGPFYWYPRVYISFGFFFSAFHWHDHHVVVINHRYRDHHYYRRSEIIHNSHVDRWRHNPIHRRGVAYRSNQVTERYHSSRPSRVQTRHMRTDERDIAVQGRLNKDKNRTVNVNRNSSTNRTNSEHPVTRQQRIREQLEQRESVHQRQDSRQVRNNNRLNQGDDRAINPRDLKNRQVETRQRDVAPKQMETNREDSRRVHQDRQVEQQRETPPNRDTRQQDDRDPPAARQNQSYQKSERSHQSRNVHSQRTERSSSQRSNRAQRRQDDHRR